MILAAVAVLLVGLFGGGATWVHVGDIDWQPHKPVWLLRREANVHGTPAAKRALGELNRRLQMGALSITQVQAVAADAMLVQADPAIPWNTAWGDFVQHAHDKSMLTVSAWDRYWSTALDNLFSLTFRPRIARGESVPYRLKTGPLRAGQSSGMHIEHRRHDMISGELMLLPTQTREGVYGRGTISPDGESSLATSFNLTDDQWRQLKDGWHEVAWTIEVRLFDGQGQMLAGKHLVVTGTFEVVPAGSVVVRPVLSPSHRSAMTSGLRVRDVQVSDYNGRRHVDGLIDLSPLPVSLAMDIVIVDEAGRQWPAGSFTRAAHIGMGQGFYLTGDAEAFNARKVAIRLLPSATLATGSVDIEDYWDEPIELSDVPVDWSAVPEAQRPLQSSP